VDTIGFIGLGTMGEPMALNLQRAGFPLVVWNRNPVKAEALVQAGALLTAGPAEVFARCQVVLAMLVDGEALDQVLGRNTPAFHERVKGRLIVSLATHSAAYAKGLAVAVRAAGGRYAEAPVSGSRKPAEAAQLVAMMAGDLEDLERLRPVLAAMCRQLVPCGAVPSGTLMKTSTALFNIAMITALSEAMNFAARQGLDLDRFNEVLLGSPMASDVVRVKAPKIARRDFAAQASVRNVLEVNRLLVEAALESGVPTPLADACRRIHEQALVMGFGDEDMIAVLKAYEASPREALR
jgi:3-hydroxyisobutyrate dehydrogenase